MAKGAILFLRCCFRNAALDMYRTSLVSRGNLRPFFRAEIARSGCSVCSSVRGSSAKKMRWDPMLTKTHYLLSSVAFGPKWSQAIFTLWFRLCISQTFTHHFSINDHSTNKLSYGGKSTSNQISNFHLPFTWISAFLGCQTLSPYPKLSSLTRTLTQWLLPTRLFFSSRSSFPSWRVESRVSSFQQNPRLQFQMVK